MSEAESLRHCLEAQLRQPYPYPVTALVQAIRARHGEAVAAVLLYGSCVRSGDPFDGLVDLYVLVDDYTKVYPKSWLALANRLLPPNVFYLEAAVGGKALRAKYAVLSRRDFASGMAWFQSYLWGRFAQPCRLLYCRDPEISAWIVTCLLKAMRTFVRRTAPLCSECFEPMELWRQGLRLSYSSELRTERAEARAKELVRWAAGFYQTVTLPLLRALPWCLKSQGGRVCLTIPQWVRILARLAWGVRVLQGKLLSLLRLIKAAFTFQGGVDYLIFKLERHSGRKIELPERVRRHPLVYGWGMLWRLYRQGVFR
ncbi:hypothetical protein JCM13664_14990 [Methylothermus subterraneus]